MKSKEDNEELEEIRPTMLLILSSFLIVDTLFLKDSNDLLVLFAIFGWYLFIRRLKTSNKIFLLISIILIVTIPLILIVNLDSIAKKMAILVFYLLCIKLFEDMRSIRKNF